jgi:hypothetical protein
VEPIAEAVGKKPKTPQMTVGRRRGGFHLDTDDPGTLLGPLLETFVTGEIRRQIIWSTPRQRGRF